jgi:hypothetical protein
MDDAIGEVESVDKEELWRTGRDLVGVRIGTGRVASAMMRG